MMTILLPASRKFQHSYKTNYERALTENTHYSPPRILHPGSSAQEMPWETSGPAQAGNEGGQGRQADTQAMPGP